jgi:hypothetical protein
VWLLATVDVVDLKQTAVACVLITIAMLLAAEMVVDRLPYWSLAFALIAGVSMLVMSFNFDNAPTWFTLTVQVAAGIEVFVVVLLGWHGTIGQRQKVAVLEEEPAAVSVPLVASLQPYQEGRRPLAMQSAARPEDYLPQPYVA